MSQAGQKKQQNISIKSFYANAFYGFEYRKNCKSKLSIKRFIKRRKNVHAYRILLSFKTSAIYKKN